MSLIRTLLAAMMVCAASSVAAPVTQVAAATDAQTEKMKAMNAVTGRTVVYQVADYKIRVEFLAEDKLRWTYLDAPDGQTGKSVEENVDRRDIHYGIILMAWTEADGTNVVDVFDFQTMTLHANAVMPNGKRFFIKTDLTEVE